MDLIYIASAPEQVRAAEAAGVDRIMVDLEIRGKMERQGHLNTVISNHSLSDVETVRGLLSKSSLLVRVNPLFDQSVSEIEAVLALGADIVMLPMFKSVCEVQEFVDIVGGRARTCLLLETAESLARAEEILSISGIDEVHIGLNDLHLSLGLTFMFEVLTGGLVGHLSSVCRKQGLKFGFGGIARVGGGLLPAVDIIAEHVRLGSSQVILSRDFRSIFDGRAEQTVADDFYLEVLKLRDAYKRALKLSESELRTVQRRVAASVAEIVKRRSGQ